MDSIRCRTPPAANLSKSSYAWAHTMTFMIFRDKVFIKLAGSQHTNSMAARSNHGHVTAKDIDELRKFIKAAFA